LKQNHQRVTIRASPPLGIDLRIGQSVPEVKKHL
jgi:hypothetical protein